MTIELLLSTSETYSGNEKIWECDSSGSGCCLLLANLGINKVSDFANAMIIKYLGSNIDLGGDR